MTVGLPISNLINVAVNLAITPTQTPNFNSMLILGTGTAIDTVTRIRAYSSLAAVSLDFSTTSDEYLAASLWFGQQPQPTSITLGRWCKTAAAGQLVGGAIAAANQAVSVWNVITNGSFTITVDNGTLQNVTGLNFSAASNMNGVASIINTALGLLSPAASVVWNATYSQFIITSATTGPNSKISYGGSTGSGTDISTLAGFTLASGAIKADGVAAESALAAVTLIDNAFSSQFYGLVVPAANSSDHQAVAAYIEGATTPHIYGVTSADANTLNSSDSASIAFLLKQAGYNKTMVQYSSTNAYAVVSAMARILTTNWLNTASAITLFYKQEPGVAAETLTQSQLNIVTSKNANVFTAYNNGTSILQNGVCCSGQFVDTIIGVDWLKSQIQTSIFNVLFSSTTKVPNTDAGMNVLATQIEAACAQGVANGLLAPGVWLGAGFGQIATGSYLSKGYYVFAPPVSQETSGQRNARVSVPFQVAARLAGAVHTVSVTLNVA